MNKCPIQSLKITDEMKQSMANQKKIVARTTYKKDASLSQFGISSEPKNTQTLTLKRNWLVQMTCPQWFCS